MWCSLMARSVDRVGRFMTEEAYTWEQLRDRSGRSSGKVIVVLIKYGTLYVGNKVCSLIGVWKCSDSNTDTVHNSFWLTLFSII